MGNINLHVYQSSFKHESRILKETKSLVDFGLVDKVFIIAIWENGLKEHEHLDSRREVWRVRLKTRYLPDGSFWKVLKFIEWWIKIFIRFKKEGITLFNSHNLLVLPLGVAFKIFVKSKLVYDTHELETETAAMSATRKKISKMIEKLFVCHVDSIIVVSDSIAEWYQNQYNLKEVHVIRNVPYSQDIKTKNSTDLKRKLNIQDNEILYIYQGALDRGRGIEILLNVFSHLNKKKHIVFMGYGVLEDEVKKYEKNFSNIHFQPAVKPDDVKYYTASADAGISLIENTCLSYQYSLPNKMFEYISCGLPLIVSDFPDMGKIVDENKCGWSVPVEKNSVAELIENISEQELGERRKNVLKCKDKFGWHQEEEKLLQLYRNLAL